MLMREALGKVVTVRVQPAIAAEPVGTLAPLATVTAIKIVEDLDHPADREYQWLQLEDATFANYAYPPAGIRFEWLDAPQGPSFPFDLYRVKWDFEAFPYGFAPRPAAVQRLEPYDHTLMDETIQNLWFDQIKIEGQGLSQDDLLHAWRWLTGSKRFLANGQGTDVRCDYISGERLDEPLPGIFPLASAGNVLRGTPDDDRVDHLRVDTLHPGMTYPSDLSHAKHPWWIHYGTSSTGRRLADGTYLCNPLSTRFWEGRHAPYPLFSSAPVRIEMRFLQRIPAGTPLPSPYNPPRDFSL
ncbi:MAG TPA: hypothetical protein VLL49_07510 [Anaerolineales bacterium]|nr:hypothetical protein [Anaerolineales bacterium]